MILELIEQDITQYYPQFKNCIKSKGFFVAMDYFDKRDEWLKKVIKEIFNIKCKL